MAVRGNVLKTLAPLDATDAFKEHLKRISNMNEPPRNTPLHVAALNGDVEEVRRLLEQKKVAVSTEDVNGYTALHHAALLSRIEIASLLLEHGANVNTATQDGSTALHKAAQGGNVECVQLLLRAGADIHAKNARGERPIDVCAMRKHTALTTFLRSYVGDS